MARATPSHTERSASERSWRLRKAAMMPTISEASRPSRRAITNVVSTGSSGVGG
jgi:hypothetical protein